MELLFLVYSVVSVFFHNCIMVGEGFGWYGHLYLLVLYFCLVHEKADLVIMFPALLQMSERVSTWRCSLQRFSAIISFVLNLDCRAIISSIINLSCVVTGSKVGIGTSIWIFFSDVNFHIDVR